MFITISVNLTFTCKKGVVLRAIVWEGRQELTEMYAFYIFLLEFCSKRFLNSSTIDKVGCMCPGEWWCQA